MNSTYKKHSKRKIVLSAISILCALATLIGIASFALSSLFTSTAQYTSPFDGIYTDSAKAVDFENAVYRIDENGNVWEESDEAIRLVMKKDARLLAVYDSDIYVLTESVKGFFLSKLDLIGGSIYDSKNLGKNEIKCFSITKSGVYYLSENKIFLLSSDNKTSTELDLSKLTYECKDEHCGHSESISFTSTEAFTVHSESSVILYIPNSEYIDEEQDSSVTDGENDKYFTFEYDFASKSLSEYSDTDNISASASGTATSSKITLNGVTLPFSNYPAYSSYFTKNGRACTCHPRNQCLVNSSPCNCLRYIKHNGYTFDLAATQCFGFARYCQLKVFGHTDGSDPSKYTNALGGAWNSGSFTANDIKNVFTQYGAGGHVRTKAGHSLFVISVNATGFTTYECNTNNKDCLVYTRDWTWATFYNAVKSRGLYYYKIPTGFSNPDIPVDNYPTGDYLIDADGGLRLREKASTGSSVLAMIPDGTIVTITETLEIDGASSNRWWGKTTYNGKTGWISLDYARLQSEISAIKITTLPERTVFFQNESFSYEGLEVQLVYASGTYGTLPGGYTVTPPNMSKPGTYKVTVSYLSFSTSYEITIKSTAILPEKIVFERPTITVMTGGEFTPVYGVDYSVLPADANDKTVEWSVVSGSHLVSVDKDTGVVTASKAGANFIDGYARIRATSLAKDADGKSVGVYSEYIVEVIKAPVDGEWSQSATNLPDGVTLSDYVIEYCASESDFKKGNWKTYDGEASKVYRYRFRDSYKLTWYYDLDSSDGNIELPSSLGYPKSANIGEKVTLSKLKTVTQTNKIFVGWFTSAEGARNLDKKLAYNADAIKGDTEFFAGWIDLSSEEFLVNAAENDPIHPVGKNLQAFGVFASDINISDESGGLRFYGHISSALIERLSKFSSKEVSYGMVLQIASNTSGPLTSATSEGYLQDGKSIVVTAKKNYGEFKFLGSGSYIVFTSLAANIPLEDAKTDIAARGFITYYDVNGIRHAFYYTNTEENTPDMSLKASGVTSNLYKCAEKMYASASDLEKNWLIENVLGHDYEG
ncbi:MAG: SH3 domain-containing protein [Clostridia bacterium]|nr:SH3 domain-containing protein [Clostridia bacterium]